MCYLGVGFDTTTGAHVAGQFSAAGVGYMQSISGHVSFVCPNSLSEGYHYSTLVMGAGGGTYTLANGYMINIVSVWG